MPKIVFTKKMFIGYKNSSLNKKDELINLEYQQVGGVNFDILLKQYEEEYSSFSQEDLLLNLKKTVVDVSGIIKFIHKEAEEGENYSFYVDLIRDLFMKFVDPWIFIYDQENFSEIEKAISDYKNNELANQILKNELIFILQEIQENFELIP